MINRNTPQLLVIGMNHRSSSIEEREKFQISRDDIPASLKYFNSLDNIDGAVIISTCNRLEFYLIIDKNADPIAVLKKFYKEKDGIDIVSRMDSFYYFDQSDAVRHLFKVVAGLDSMVLGEYQIQGQLKEAYGFACAEKTAEKILHKLFHAAFRVGKKIRANTKIGKGKQSLSGVAYQLVKERLKLKDRITIIGVNQSTKIFAQHMRQAGFHNLLFVNRTFYKASELANKYGGQAERFENLEQTLSGSDCIFSCTGSDGYIINSEIARSVFTESRKPKIMIDMAVPRDIETKNLPDSIKVFDLEDLDRFLANNKKEHESDIPLAEKIIDEEVGLFEDWTETQKDDILEPFNEKIEFIRNQLLEETKSKFSEDQLKILDKFSQSLIHRMKSTFNEAVRSRASSKNKK